MKRCEMKPCLTFYLPTSSCDFNELYLISLLLNKSQSLISWWGPAWRQPLPRQRPPAPS